jgi:hypothetical protein
MKFAIVYRAIIHEVLSTVIYPGFVDKDCWNGRAIGIGLRIGSRHVELGGCDISSRSQHDD